MKKILGIETSCDETAVAIVRDDKKILANRILSQQDHAVYGGVVPEVAARAHLSHLDGLVRQALEDSGLELRDLSAIAATTGPGLIGGLLVGATTAKAMAAVCNLPFIAVNHLEGHALSVRLTEDVPFPYLLLLASGGHCQILIVRGVGAYTQLGATVDDAVGEAFDKTAKLMGLGYPGGPAVEKMAQGCRDPQRALERFPLPRPMLGQDHCNFSFSGLKTAVRRIVDAWPDPIEVDDVADLCFSFQQSVGDVLCDRLARALRLYKKMNPQHPALVIAGGVGSNKTLRARLETLAQDNDLRFVAPPPFLCTDNAAMIAWAGVERFALGMTDPLDAPLFPRWPLDTTPHTVRTA